MFLHHFKLILGVALTILLLNHDFVFSQDFVEPINIGSLIPGEIDETKNLGAIFTRAGDINKFDIVIVMYGEHMSDAVVMGFRGLKTGIIFPEEEKKMKCEAVYVTQRPLDDKAGREKKFEEDIPVDSKSHLALYELAWDLVQTPKVDIQTKNLDKKFDSINSCYFLINSRLHANSEIIMGGYIQNPQDETKSSKFLLMAYSIWNKWQEMNPLNHTFPDK